jgi:hypothetical protein
MALRLSVYAAAALYPTGIFLVLISVRGWVNLRAVVHQEGIGKLKNLTPSPGFEPATFRFVAYHLNQLRYCIPSPTQRGGGVVTTCPRLWGVKNSQIIDSPVNYAVLHDVRHNHQLLCTAMVHTAPVWHRHLRRKAEQRFWTTGLDEGAEKMFTQII